MNSKNVIAVAVAALGLTAGAAGLATAGPGDTRPQAATTSTTAAGRPAHPGGAGRGHPGPLARAVHGDLIVRTQDGFEPVTFDRGTLTSADDDSLTLHRPDGADVTVKLSDDTRYVGVENAAALEDGKRVTVVHKDGTAKAVIQRDTEDGPRPGARQRPGGAQRPGGGQPPQGGAAPAGFEDLGEI
jgi:hypothetical protein